VATSPPVLFFNVRNKQVASEAHCSGLGDEDHTHVEGICIILATKTKERRDCEQVIEIWTYSVIAAVAVSAVSLIGAVGVVMREDFLKKIVTMLVSLAVGVLLGDVFIHLLPEALEQARSPRSVLVFVLIGMLLFFFLEKVVKWQHGHAVGAEISAIGPRSCAQMCLIGDAFHNFIDGTILASSFLVSPAVGMATTIAIIAHEIPQEISDVGILLYGGYAIRRAVWLNFLCSLSVVAGAAVTLVLSSSVSGIALYMLPIAAGGFIYIAASDLIPQLQQHFPVRLELAQAAMVTVGVLLMAAVIVLEHSFNTVAAHIEITSVFAQVKQSAIVSNLLQARFESAAQ